MTATIAVIVLTLLCGAPVSLLVDRSRPASARAGERFLFGAGVVWAIVMLLSLTGIGWSRPAFGIATPIVAAAPWTAALPPGGFFAARPPPSRPQPLPRA